MSEEHGGRFRVGDQVRVVRGNSLVEAGQHGHVGDVRLPTGSGLPLYKVITPDGKRHWLREDELDAGEGASRSGE